MFKNSTHEIIVHKTPKFAAQYGCELLYNSDYPHSRNGSGGYPPSGGGIKKGSRVPRDAPVLSLNISPGKEAEDMLAEDILREGIQLAEDMRLEAGDIQREGIQVEDRLDREQQVDILVGDKHYGVEGECNVP
nr:hypothetical protein Iba_chr04aCG15190 [Ipomoea batatas]